MSAEPSASLQNFVAEINGHQIYRDADGVRCHLWTAGVGWWGFDLSEAEARLTAESVQPPDAPKAEELKAERLPQVESRKCNSCGEPEDGGQLGWFDAEDGLHCNSCGSDPLAKPKKKKKKAEEKPKPDVPRYLVTVGRLRIKLRQKQRGEWQAVEWFERGTCRGRELLVQTTDALAADAIAQDYRFQHQEDK